MTCILRLQCSISIIQDFMIGNIVSAEIDAQGIKREIHDHFLNKLETKIANKVLVGSSGVILGRNIFPLYKTYQI